MNLKLRTKIVLIALVSLLLAIGVNATISSYIITREYSNALRSRTLVIGQSLALQLDRLLKYGIFLDEVAGFEKQCQEIVTEYQDVSYAMVVDTEGKILFHNDPTQRGQRLTDPVLLDAAKGTVAQVLEVYPQPGEGYFDATIPVRDSRDRHVAAVKVGLPTQLVAQRTQALLLSSGAAALVSLGLAIILLVVMLPVWVTRPLGQLLAAVQEIGQKGAAASQRVQIRSQDEVGQLASAFNGMTEQIRDLVSGLEQRVAERTADLERRSAYMRASAEVGRAAASILDVDELTRQVVELIREHFRLYYVGLFLVDSSQQWAVLQAGTGEAGQALRARGHRLPVGEGSMVGWCIANTQPRVALEVGEDAVRLATAELPDTRSEAALPLFSRGRVLGALTVQSDQPGAFDQAALAVLQLMADQVAVALDNAQLFAESQANLESARRAYGELSLKGWANLLRAQPDLGYRGDKRGIARAPDAWAPEMEEALRAGQTIQAASDGQDADTAAEKRVAIPIKVRGQAIAVLDTQRPGGLHSEEIALLEALAEQLGQALESARLYQDSQRRAAREQLASQITSRMRESLDIDRILQTAVREFGETLGVAEAKIQLVPFDRQTHP